MTQECLRHNKSLCMWRAHTAWPNCTTHLLAERDSTQNIFRYRYFFLGPYFPVPVPPKKWKIPRNSPVPVPYFAGTDTGIFLGPNFLVPVPVLFFGTGTGTIQKGEKFLAPGSHTLPPGHWEFGDLIGMAFHIWENPQLFYSFWQLWATKVVTQGNCRQCFATVEQLLGLC